MDEIYFHLSRHIETLQIYVTSFFNHGRHFAVTFSQDLSFQVQNVWSQSWSGQVNIALQGFTNFIRDVTRHCSTVWAQPNQVVSQLAELATVEMPIFYPGGAGFIVGAAVGLFFGLSWNPSVIVSQRMKSVVCMAYDGLEGVSSIDDGIVPALTKPQQILIQVKFASVDIIDLKICCGYGKSIRKLFNSESRSELPVILGRDCSGVVVEIGPKVKSFEIGDEVWVVLPFWISGTLAEYIVTTEDMVSKKPDFIDFKEASSIPYAGCLAYSACAKAGILKKAEGLKRVLIHSGVSPVGCIACQLAKFYDWEVTVTCTDRAQSIARALKADKIVVYGNIKMENELSQDRFDVVLNTVGGVGHESCLKLCKPNGMVVSTVPEHIFNDNQFPLFGIYLRIKCFLKKYFGNSHEWNGFDFSSETLDILKDLVNRGVLRPLVDKEYEPHEVVGALQHCDSVGAIGKTVIRFRNKSVYDR